VLELLREKLTNERIAERLGITPDGAKYHVSQILSKLSVDNRKEAARWQPHDARQWWRILLPLPFAAKAAGVAVIATTVIGLGAFAVLATQVDTSKDSISLPPPVYEPMLTREQVLVRAGQIARGDLLEVSLQASTSGAIQAFLDGEPAEVRTERFDTHPNSTAWLVRFRGIMTQRGSVLSLDRANRGSTLDKRCRDLYLAFLEGTTPPTIVVGLPLPDSACSTFSITEDMVLVYAASFAPGIVEVTARNIALKHATLGQVEELALDPSGPFADIYDDSAWVATLDGEFYTENALSQERFATPTCGTAMIILQESGAWVETFVDEGPCP
jgi:hypothetical protein